MATTAERIKLGMEIRGLKQADIVERSGINKGALSCYISGKYKPKQNSIYLIAKALDVNEAWLMGADVPMERPSKTACQTKNNASVRIPVLGRVAAGIPIDAIEEVIDYEEIPEVMAHDGDYFGLLIKGNSMEPRIVDGDVVIVRKQEDADDGDLIIALVNGEEGCCKRLKKYENGTIALVSTNPAFDPMYFTPSEQNETPVKIIGKVKELRAKF